jgi:hypothetical protein
MDAPGAAGEIGKKRERVRPVPAVVLGGGGLGKDVIGHEHAVEAQLLRARRQRCRVDDRELPDRKHDPVIHQSLLGKCEWAPSVARITSP